LCLKARRGIVVAQMCKLGSVFTFIVNAVSAVYW
jgi:hypothetical protein